MANHLSGYLSALVAAGMPEGSTATQIDAWAAAAMRVGLRTARRWRLGQSPVPGPAWAALEAMRKTDTPTKETPQ